MLCVQSDVLEEILAVTFIHFEDILFISNSHTAVGCAGHSLDYSPRMHMLNPNIGKWPGKEFGLTQNVL